MGIRKVDELNFLNKEVEEFISRWSWSLINARSPNYFKEKTFDVVYEVQPDYIFSVLF